MEVVVTDRKGNRIRGLQASDFELLVDRRPVRIDYFTEIDDGRALATSDDQISNVPALAPDEPVGTNYLIFIDDLFAIKQRRNRVLTRLERDLVQLEPADRVAVVANDGRELTLITDWTGTREDIETALQEARKRKPHGLLYRYGMGADRGDKTRRSVMAAAGAMRSFANAPGRKVMLLLIEGWATVSDSWNFGSAYAAASAGATLDRPLWASGQRREPGRLQPLPDRPARPPRPGYSDQRLRHGRRRATLRGSHWRVRNVEGSTRAQIP